MPWLLLALSMLVRAQTSPTLTLQQSDLLLDDGLHLHSDWGSATLTFSGMVSQALFNAKAIRIAVVVPLCAL